MMDNHCCYRCSLRDKCPHPDRFYCNLIDRGTCTGQRACVPCPDFKDASEAEHEQNQ
jgi:hypothetical protein